MVFLVASTSSGVGRTVTAQRVAPVALTARLAAEALSGRSMMAKTSSSPKAK
jgi:hypothetical protein